MADSLLLSSSEDSAGAGKRQRLKLQYLPLITFAPVGNPLERLSAQQRQLFFDSLFRMLHLQRLNDLARAAADARVPASLAGAAAIRMQFPSQQVWAKGAAGQQDGKKAGTAQETAKPALMQGTESAAVSIGVTPGWQASPLAQRQGIESAAASIGIAQGAQAAVPSPAQVQAAGQKLALVLDDYARGDAAKAKGALSDFESQLVSQNYRADDLMAVMLLVIEDRIWAGEEAGLGEAKFGGSRARNPVIPTRLRQSAMDSAEVRLASVREMLRYYFERHPKEYATALAAALGITADQEDDVQFLQERLAFELASVGSFALSQKILAAVRKKMDHSKCMLEMGYFYDRKKKRLVLGKRTCGKPAEAKGIIGLLMGGIRQEKPPDR